MLSDERRSEDKMRTPKEQAIQILQDAALRVAKSGEAGSNMKINTLHNAVVYLLTGKVHIMVSADVAVEGGYRPVQGGAGLCVDRLRA